MNEHEINAYDAIMEQSDHTHWAFGTGFDDPLAGVDPSVPEGMDAAELAAYCLMLGDDALIYSHRLSEWCTNAPELEDEVALANIALDLLGQARLLLSRAAQARGEGDEDSLAYLRDAHEFRNVHLAELPRGDFAQEIARLLVFSIWRLALLERLTESADPVLAAIATKGVKELSYHRDYAAGWTVRLGDGTEFSHERMTAGLAAIWPYTAELFISNPVEQRIGVDPAQLRAEFDAVLAQVLEPATLTVPDVAPMARVANQAGRDGVHTEALSYLLAEMQSVARAYPGATW
ncbi:MAG TPA: 1,2-phenylacetyl-CoA epoxidase subunit PaaC [Jatrophihabitantaceae bacterium]|jgi:ring-1,2-phenylacetyl-CoA epoxidase subunit PaaC